MTDLYENQRAMRAMRRAALQRGVIAILDIGTSAFSSPAVAGNRLYFGGMDGRFFAVGVE